MNSFVQKIFDLLNLRQAAATMVFNQDDYLRPPLHVLAFAFGGISTRMNSFVQKIFDLLNLRQAAATMVFNQDDYLRPPLHVLAFAFGGAAALPPAFEFLLAMDATEPANPKLPLVFPKALEPIMRQLSMKLADHREHAHCAADVRLWMLRHHSLRFAKRLAIAMSGP
jgi:hypothetical protein